MKKFILLSAVLLLVFSCSEEEDDPYDVCSEIYFINLNNITGNYFIKVIGNDNAINILKDDWEGQEMGDTYCYTVN